MYGALTIYELWDANSVAVAAGEPGRKLALSTGAEMMRRTDTSPARVKQSNEECAVRAERHPA